jgi:hypothetical protein
MCVEVETRTLEEVDEVVDLLKAARQLAQAASSSAPPPAAAAGGGGGSQAGPQLGSRGTHVTRVMLDNMAVRDGSQPGGVDVRMLAEVRPQRRQRPHRTQLLEQLAPRAAASCASPAASEPPRVCAPLRRRCRG